MHQIKTTLYALNKDGSYQQWKVFTDGDKVIVEFGKLDGKLQYKETICTPKNVGRANETTAEQQAELEAISKWEKQVRLGYVENMEDCEQGVDLLPMLVHDYLKRGKALKLPCWILRKLDGLRLLVVFQNGEPKFISRGNKSYPIQGKLLEQLLPLGLNNLMGNYTFMVFLCRK